MLLVSVNVCACLCVCVPGTGMGRGCFDRDGDRVEAEGGPEVWCARKAAVSEEARA